MISYYACISNIQTKTFSKKKFSKIQTYFYARFFFSLQRFHGLEMTSIGAIRILHRDFYVVLMDFRQW